MINTLRHFDPEDPYPDSDGQPMAENTLQFQWIVKIKENLEILFAERPDVFVAGDLLWYPDPDRQTTGPVAPDVLVAFGRPKGYRGSYKQWEEDGIAPQVVFEILSPSNSSVEMEGKRIFYERYGVEEYYVYDPDHHQFEAWVRQQPPQHLRAVPTVGSTTSGDPAQVERLHLDQSHTHEPETSQSHTDQPSTNQAQASVNPPLRFRSRLRRQNISTPWTSPRLGIQFIVTADALEILYPSGQRFLTSIELAQRAEAAEQQATAERQRAETAEQRAETVEQRAAQLAERLRALGIDPDGS